MGDRAPAAPHRVAQDGQSGDLDAITVADIDAESIECHGLRCQAVQVDQLKSVRGHLIRPREQGSGNVDEISGLRWEGGFPCARSK